MGPASPSSTGYNGNPSAALVSPGSGSRHTHEGGGRGGGWGGIPRQRTPPRNYNFSPNYNPPHLNTSPPNGDNSEAPPQAPVLQDRSVRASEAFFVNAGDSESTREIKLTVEFPTQAKQDSTNDISLYFKRFAIVLLAAHPSISILNWENPAQNPVTKAIDIAPTEESIRQ